MRVQINTPSLKKIYLLPVENVSGVFESLGETLT